VPPVYRGFALHPDDDKDPYAFRVDLSEFGIGTGRVLFSREPAAGATALHLDLIPMSLYRQPAMTNPRRWATGTLAAAATAMAVRRGFTARRRRGVHSGGVRG